MKNDVLPGIDNDSTELGTIEMDSPEVYRFIITSSSSSSLQVSENLKRRSSFNIRNINDKMKIILEGLDKRKRSKKVDDDDDVQDKIETQRRSVIY